jgi:hypothetical protein
MQRLLLFTAVSSDNDFVHAAVIRMPTRCPATSRDHPNGYALSRANNRTVSNFGWEAVRQLIDIAGVSRPSVLNGIAATWSRRPRKAGRKQWKRMPAPQAMVEKITERLAGKVAFPL